MSKGNQDTYADDATKYKRYATLETLGYRVGRTIGSGSYAKVKEAFSEARGQMVAIKIIKKKHLNNAYLTKFLPREVRVLRRLNHPYIIAFLHFIETADHAYMVMEYASKGDMLRLIMKSRYLKENSAARWFGQLVSALDFCHRNGVVHRDLKCENLLIDLNNDLKLSDFGFARGDIFVEGKEALCQTYCGSYAYSPPEVLTNTPYEARLADIWSIGVILYIMVYGQFPFDDSDHRKLLEDMKRGPVFPSDPNVSSSCRSLLKRILSKRDARYTIPHIIAHRWFRRTVPVETQEFLAEQGAHKDPLGATIQTSGSTILADHRSSKSSLRRGSSGAKRETVVDKEGRSMKQEQIIYLGPDGNQIMTRLTSHGAIPIQIQGHQVIPFIMEECNSRANNCNSSAHLVRIPATRRSYVSDYPSILSLPIDYTAPPIGNRLRAAKGFLVNCDKKSPKHGRHKKHKKNHSDNIYEDHRGYKERHKYRHRSNLSSKSKHYNLREFRNHENHYNF